jgi:hypothetical protein
LLCIFAVVISVFSRCIFPIFVHLIVLSSSTVVSLVKYVGSTFSSSSV